MLRRILSRIATKWWQEVVDHSLYSVVWYPAASWGSITFSRPYLQSECWPLCTQWRMFPFEHRYSSVAILVPWKVRESPYVDYREQPDPKLDRDVKMSLPDCCEESVASFSASSAICFRSMMASLRWICLTTNPSSRRFLRSLKFLDKREILLMSDSKLLLLLLESTGTLPEDQDPSLEDPDPEATATMCDSPSVDGFCELEPPAPKQMGSKHGW